MARGLNWSTVDIRRIEAEVKRLHGNVDELPFHGWPHVNFVTKIAAGVAAELGADAKAVEVASLVHDLNHCVEVGSDAAAGNELRSKVLHAAGMRAVDASSISEIVLEATTSRRHSTISAEAQALSDGDTLFKALPTTPILFAKRFMIESGAGIERMAERIVTRQSELLESGIYFYAESLTRRYLPWASTNLDLWRNVLDSLAVEEVQQLLNEIGDA